VHLKLLDILCCPLCHAALEVSGVERRDAEEILEGSLRCRGCARVFPVIAGVPDLLPGTQHSGTLRAFSFQWQLAFRGRFERNTLYGYDVEKLVAWVFANCFGPVSSSDWLLDAGCGRGDKTIEMAWRNPQAQVVGMDLSNTLALSRKSASLPNLHFIRADVLKPPIQDKTIARAMSWGVLHHTPDTAGAFQSIARTLKPSGQFAVWLYPNPADSDLFNMAYEIRDVHFMGRGHRIPRKVLSAILPVYVLLSTPYFLLRYGNVLRDPRLAKDYLPMDKLPLMEKLRAAHFIYLDNLIPEFQDRPLRTTVENWYAQCGFGAVEWNDPGLFWATKGAF